MVQYFSIPTIRAAIEHLQNYSGNWLIPAFVLAANDVGTDEPVDMARSLGTDQFLNRYFNGSRLDIPSFASGNNLLRPRLKDVTWRKGQFAYDYMIRQDTKMWANLYSSRGYREMRLQGLIEGERSVAQLTDDFQARFEIEVPSTFRFEHFLVWLYAFEGIPDNVGGWGDLLDHLLEHELGIGRFHPEFEGRFTVQDPELEWPSLLSARLGNDVYLEALAPRLNSFLAEHVQEADDQEDEAPSANSMGDLPPLRPDDPVLAEISGVMQRRDSLTFLLAGPPGTGKTRYARQLAVELAEGDASRIQFLQFHPAISYDDFVEGFRPVPAGNSGGVKYDIADRLFLSFLRRAAKDTSKTYVAVIDELNRADVARVLGEFLTYLEPSYRGQDFTLSYSGDPCSVPDNLVVIATANPFDRSVTDLDDALLRRFWVIEIEPDESILRTTLSDAAVEPGLINRTIQLFQVLNRTMPTGFGHTSFLSVRQPEDLVGVWSGRIRLALRRALMHDRERLEEVIEEINKLLTFPDAGDEDAEGLEE